LAEKKEMIMLSVVARLYVFLTTLWFSTCRLTSKGQEHMQFCIDNQPVIACFWHHAIIYFLHHLRSYNASVMVSASKDGEYLARIAEKLGLDTVRGSSNRHGARALKEMITRIKDGKNGGIVADGSQGPPLKVQPGVIMLSSKTGRPILPMTWSSSNFKTIKSWDRTVIPMPFSRIVMCYGKPINVPDKLSSNTLEEYRLELENEMNVLYKQAWGEFDREQHVS